MFALDTLPTAHVLNPCAITFVPFCERAKRNCVIIEILVTLLFLLVLLLIYLITNNNHQHDYVNPKNRLIKLKNNNATKILIGHLNINSIRFKFSLVI